MTTLPTVMAVDPGRDQSAWIVLDSGGQPVSFGIYNNDRIIDLLHTGAAEASPLHLAIEMVASYGMAVGADIFQTCVWIGRFIEAWQPEPWTFVFRREVKLHLCGTARAKDANVRQALIDMYGGSKEKAVGVKKAKGPLWGISKDVWSALSVGVTWQAQQRELARTGTT